MLGTNAEENDPAGVRFYCDNRRASIHQVFAAKPSGSVDLAVGVARGNANFLRGESLGELEERRVDVEAVGLGRDAASERVGGIDLKIYDGAGREVLVAIQSLFQIFYS